MSKISDVVEDIFVVKGHGHFIKIGMLAIIILIANLPTDVFGQKMTMKLTVYFDNDQYTLKLEAEKAIDNALDSLANLDVFKVNVTGNTDNSADSLYNAVLSKKRTEEVSRYLVEKGINEEKIKTNYLGENNPIADNALEEGKQKNRRVDMVFFYRLKIENVESEKETKPMRTTPIDTCQKDTTIVLAAGTQLVFNRCEYLELKDCLEITEANSGDEILENELNLSDSNGTALASCGMIRIAFKPGCSNKECFDIAVKVRFPVPEEKNCDYCGRNARLWNISEDGTWAQFQGKRSELKIVKVNGESFYQFEMLCPNNWKNCDCILPRGKKVKIRTNREYQILNVKFISDCPRTLKVSKPNRRKNVVRTRLYCNIEEWYVVATVMDADGKILKLEKMPLNDLDKRTFLSRCARQKGENIGYRFGIFPIGKRSFYRKYVIHPSDLKSI